MDFKLKSKRISISSSLRKLRSRSGTPTKAISIYDKLEDITHVFDTVRAAGRFFGQLAGSNISVFAKYNESRVDDECKLHKKRYIIRYIVKNLITINRG